MFWHGIQFQNNNNVPPFTIIPKYKQFSGFKLRHTLKNKQDNFIVRNVNKFNQEAFRYLI